MSSFTDPLIVTPLETRSYWWKIVKPFEYHVGEYPSPDMVVTIPVGFETNFASVPRVFWSILPPWGRYAKAAVVHDYLYRHQVGTRKEADDIFLEAMRVLSVPRRTRYVMYWFVRMFAFIWW